MKALTFNRYRTINIILLSLIFSAIEVLIVKGATTWFTEANYTLSLAITFTGLEMMRWSGFGAIAAVLSGLVFCVASVADGAQFLIYCGGNLAMLLALIYIRLIGAEKIRRNFFLTLIYALLVFILAECGRGAVAILMGEDPRMILQFLTTDSMSGVFALVVISLMRRVDGMFENQRSYLVRMEEERQKELQKEQRQYEARYADLVPEEEEPEDDQL